MLEFEWDEQKNLSNIRKHGIDFAEAPDIFRMPVVSRLDDRKEYGEDRYIGIGYMEKSEQIGSMEETGVEVSASIRLMVTLVFTYRDDKIRIISIRKANKEERNIYEEKAEAAWRRNEGWFLIGGHG